MGTRDARRDAKAFLRARVRTLQRALDDRLDQLDRSFNPTAIHGVRIAARRLRILLRAFKKDFQAPQARAYLKALRGLSHDLERARETQVAYRMLVALASAHRGRLKKQSAPLIDLAAADNARAVEGLRALARAQAWQSRRADMRRSARDPALIGANAALGPLCVRVLRRHRRRLQRGLRRAGGAAQDLHKLRLKVKVLRYLTEELAPAGADAPHAELAQLHGLQDCLGEIHDAWCLKRSLKRQDRGRRAARALRAEIDRRREELLEEFRMRRKQLIRFWRAAERG